MSNGAQKFDGENANIGVQYLAQLKHEWIERTIERLMEHGYSAPGVASDIRRILGEVIGVR